MATTGLFDVEANAKTENSAHTSQVTGTTATTAQADELVCIAHALRAATGAADVGYTNPVSGFTTHQITSNDATNVTTFHATQVVSSIGTQTATFNWTASESGMSGQACIATFRGIPPIVVAPPTIDFSTLSIGDWLAIRLTTSSGVQYTLLGQLTRIIAPPNPYGPGFSGELNAGGPGNYFRDRDTVLAWIPFVETNRPGPYVIPSQDSYTLLNALMRQFGLGPHEY
jgi:hypothetical protein